MFRFYRGSIGALLLASLIAGGVMLLNLWMLNGAAAAKLSVDRNMVTFFGAAATYAVAIGLAEHFIHVSERRQIWPSIAAGLLAFAATFLLWGGIDSFQGALADQAASIVALVVLLVGGLLGLVQFAFGATRERRLRDDPDILARALAERAEATPAASATADALAKPAPASSSGPPPSAFDALFGQRRPGGAPALVEAGDRTYFAGPVQVRTSYGMLLLSGALTGLLGLLFIACMFVIGISLQPVDQAVRDWDGLSRVALASWLIFGTLGTSLLLFVPNLIAHHVARWMKVTTGGGYALVALVTALVLCVVMPPLGIVAVIPSPIAMLLYRRIVGLEPVGLPADLVIDGAGRDALIGEDHPRRHYRRVLVQE